MLKRLFLLLVVVAIPTTKLQAANDSFVGKWKLNPERSTMHDQMKVNSAGRTATLSTLAAARNSLWPTAPINPVSREPPSP